MKCQIDGYLLFLNRCCGVSMSCFCICMIASFISPLILLGEVESLETLPTGMAIDSYIFSSEIFLISSGTNVYNMCHHLELLYWILFFSFTIHPALLLLELAYIYITYERLLASSMAWLASGLLLFCFFLPLIFSCVAHSWIKEGNGTSSSIYEVLEIYNFPVGLIPEGALGYDLNPSTGDFAAYLSGPCYFRLTNKLQLRYTPTLSGQISKDQLTNLNGVKVKVRHIWVGISEVRRDGDNLVFHVGVTYISFPVIDFDKSPRCGNCGFIRHVTFS